MNFAIWETVGVDGDVDAASTARVHSGWFKFRSLVPFVTAKDVSLKLHGKVYFACIISSMLHGSETWPMKRENEIMLHYERMIEMRMIMGICEVKLKDKLSCVTLRQRLGIDDVATVVQRNRLVQYGHVLRKDDEDWVKNAQLLRLRVKQRKENL